MLSKLIRLAFVFIIIGLLSWYFFKGYNHKITFKTNFSPLVVQDYLVRWENFKKPGDSLFVIKNDLKLKKTLLDYRVRDSVLRIDWSFHGKNDSTTIVTAKITNMNSPFFSNINVVNPKSEFYKTNISIIERFAKSLEKYGKTFKIGSITKDSIPSKYCTYVTVSSLAPNKAKSMLDNINIVMSYIKGNNIELDGNPFLEITDWDMIKDSISYNFCFPIKRNDSLPLNRKLKFKVIEKREALKVIFNGNYRDSQRAWLTLLDYADLHKINLEPFPVEFFLNDPHSGTNSLDWVAEVYMPLK